MENEENYRQQQLQLGQQKVDALKQKATAGGHGGVIGELIDRLRSENPDMSFAQALQAIQTGYRQNMVLDADGNLVPLHGASDALSSIEASKASGRKFGTEQGEKKALLRSQETKMPELEKAVDRLNEIGKKATYTTAGRAIDMARREAGMEPRKGAIARADYIATVDNIILPQLRDTFGAQFTVKEGETLRSTLGDPNKTPAEKDAVLS